jgi:hypothetical protein
VTDVADVEPFEHYRNTELDLMPQPLARPAFAYWASGSDTSAVPDTASRFPRRHRLVTMIWTWLPARAWA